MRVLVTGATGFIGRHVAARLIATGHEVVACARDTRRARTMFPGGTVLACDFNRDTTVSAWRPRLAGVDAVTAVYLAWLTVAEAGLWLEPLGPLVKTVPLVVATLVMIALEDDR
jgi:uncharacterized protein YbjT (DUF2867 family)